MNKRGAEMFVTVGLVLLSLPAVAFPGAPLLSEAWTSTGGVASGQLGFDVSSAGDVNGDGYDEVIAGSRTYIGPLAPGLGAAFVFLGGPDGPTDVPDWGGGGNRSDSELGLSVSGAGDVNGDGYADIIFGGGGAAVIYLGSGVGLGLSPDVRMFGGGSYGREVSGAGDVDDDGVDDVVVGDSGAEESPAVNGAIYLYLGGPGGPSDVASQVVTSNAPGLPGLGWGVSGLGDINADGYDDVAAAGTSSALVYNGQESGLSSSSSWTTLGARLGWTNVAAAGDVNADGLPDLLVGRSNADYVLDADTATIYAGSAGGPAEPALWETSMTAYGRLYAKSIGGAGDIDADGYDDIIVGAPFAYTRGGQSGTAFVFLGGPAGPSSAPAWKVTDGPAFAQIGHSVAAAGDVNGDGAADVVVGTPWEAELSGTVRLYLGSCATASDADSDHDGVVDGCDVCPGVNDSIDSDGDGFGNLCDVCPGFSDVPDLDGDGVPDGCDICGGSDDHGDADGDDVADGCDLCPGGDDRLDTDHDGTPDACEEPAYGEVGPPASEAVVRSREAGCGCGSAGSLFHGPSGGFGELLALLAVTLWRPFFRYCRPGPVGGFARGA